MRMLFHVDRVSGRNVACQDVTLYQQRTGGWSGWQKQSLMSGSRQELIYDLGWLFTSEPQDADIDETSNLVRQDYKTAKGSADVPCVLGR